MTGRNPQFYEIPDVAYNSIPRMPTSEVNRIALEEFKTRLDPTTGKMISDNIADLSKNMPGLSLDTIVSSAAMGMNSKTPALVVENKITDSQSKEFIGGGVVTVQGESFRLESSSVKAFQDMAKRIVTLALEAPGK